MQARHIVSAYPLTSTYMLRIDDGGITVCWGRAESSEGLARLVRDARRWGNEWREDGNVEEHQPQNWTTSKLEPDHDRGPQTLDTISEVI